jgi:hypothetical protein
MRRAATKMAKSRNDVSNTAEEQWKLGGVQHGALKQHRQHQ